MILSSSCLKKINSSSSVVRAGAGISRFGGVGYG
jgi:hypothetical protein